MEKIILSTLLAFFIIGLSQAQIPPKKHPDTSASGWHDLFAPDLSNAIRPGNVWSVEDGVITASEDQALWSEKEYDNFILDLEYQNQRIEIIYF